jgi:hypothetical protein
LLAAQALAQRAGMFELHMVALATNLPPAFSFKTLDDLPAVHRVIYHTTTHKIRG